MAIGEMIRLTREKGLFCHFFSKDTIFTERLINISTRYTEWNKYLAEEDQVKIRVLENFEDMTEQEKSEIFKAVVVDDDESKLQYVREQILKTGIVSASKSLADNIEIMSKEVSKGNAVSRLAELLCIDKSEIITIGDNENDISMIEYAGLGVAMGNAEQCLKDKADYVTADYMADGVAQVVEKFIL
jgi:Cof subfamily protein (haloacid dehalogenase superfamily)